MVEEIKNFQENIKLKSIEKNVNATTGDTDHLYEKLSISFKNAESIDIIVSFIMKSGVETLIEDLRNAVSRGVKIRILTGSYLNITQPEALYLLKSEFKDKIDLRFYKNTEKSFHPKSYIFHRKEESEIYIGSSNISRGALTDSIEWNFRFLKSDNPNEYDIFYSTFEDLFYNHSIIVTDEVLSNYSKQWKRPNIYKDLKRAGIDVEESKSNVIDLYKPKGAQIEALYLLNNTREEGFDKGLVVAATGIGKTYLAAFDSKEYKRVLFVAHREEIIKQAAISFRNVRNTDDIGFFYSDKKDIDKSIVFALVQTLGRKEYLNDKYFSRDYFDYIVVDEFHHAVSKNYRNIIDYFKPEFLLGLTATPERLDNGDVFSICDYNTVYEVRLKEAINKGWLCPFKYYGIYDETVDYENIEFKNGKYNEAQLENALMLNLRAELIFNHYMKYYSEKALGFCTSKKHAEYMAKYFNSRGIDACAVYSGEGGEYTEERSRAIKKLKNGELKVVFSVDMFNEGLDVPAIDMVLFLRPTQSPTIFLQQLGRGLRKYKNKEYVTVLDFIGNYKKANLIPFLLSGKNYSASQSKRNKQSDYEFPDDCSIDFDFRLIDIFKKQAENEMPIKERIKDEFYRIKEECGGRPDRVELFSNMDENIYDNIKSKKSLNPFSDYLKFLKENNELTNEEEGLMTTRGYDFINMIETTSMSKTYKMPLLLAFYNDGDIKMSVTEEDVYKSFYDFYRKGSNKIDMLKDKGTRDFENWDIKQYMSLVMRNPVNALLKTHGDFFMNEEGKVLALQEDLRPYIREKAFIDNMKDAIEYRINSYYKNRVLKGTEEKHND